MCNTLYMARVIREQEKMVFKGSRGMGLLVLLGIAVAGMAVILLTVLFWPKAEEPVGLVVSMQGTAAAGGQAVFQVEVTSGKARDVTLVAELLTSARQHVNIVREKTKVAKGPIVVVLKMPLSATLPAGRYVGVVSARYEQKIVQKEVSVRVLAAEKPAAPTVPVAQPPAAQPAQPVNTTPGNETLPTPPSQPATPPSQQPSQNQGMPIELDDVAEMAKTDKPKALALCESMAPPDDSLCVSRVAATTGDDLICTRLKSAFDQDKCYLSIASTGKPGACALVQDDALRSTCDAVASFYTPGGAA